MELEAKERMKPAQILMDKETRRMADEIAEANRISTSQAVRQIIRIFYTEWKAEQEAK